MAKNPFFEETYGDASEQDVLQDLNVEAIEINGQTMYYLPRVRGNFDKVYGADDVSHFDEALPIEMYVTSWEGFQGDQEFLSKFGVEIRDRVIFTVAKRTFENLVGLPTGFTRPREGDLVWFPLNGKAFEIRHVDKKPFFYQLGDLQTYNLICELYEYSSESFNTGVPEIDALENRSLNALNYALLDEAGAPLLNEDGDYLTDETYPGYENVIPDGDNETIDDRGHGIIDFSEDNPFSEREPY